MSVWPRSETCKFTRNGVAPLVAANINGGLCFGIIWDSGQITSSFYLLPLLPVISAATSFQSHATSNVCNVAQAAALAAVSGDLAAVEVMRTAFDRRRQTMTAMLNEIPGVVCPLPEGAFYCYPSVKGVLGQEIAGTRAASSSELAELILEHADVAVVPGEAFGTPGYFRLSCALGDDDLVEGISRMGKLLSEAH